MPCFNINGNYKFLVLYKNLKFNFLQFAHQLQQLHSKDYWVTLTDPMVSM